jgi:hypothetical protein
VARARSIKPASFHHQHERDQVVDDAIEFIHSQLSEAPGARMMPAGCTGL